MFHAFASLERTVRSALEAGNEREATYRLFGQKFDSLGSLLDRALEQPELSDIDRYVLFLSAQQLVAEVRKVESDFWSKHEPELASLKESVGRVAELRLRLQEPDAGLGEFLPWFESWFLRRAPPIGVHP